MKKRILPVLFGAAAFALARFSAGSVFMASETYTSAPLNQNNALVTAPYSTNGCAPTAATMGFQYLQNTYGGNLVNANPYNTVVTVGNPTNMATDPSAATSGPNMVAGAQSYLNSVAPGSQVSSQVASLVGGNTQPTATYIYNMLQAGWAVQIGALWLPLGNPPGQPGSTGKTFIGGHALTVTGITWDDSSNTGTLNVIDPASGTALNMTLSQVTYTGLAAPPAGLAGWNNTWLQVQYQSSTVGAETNSPSTYVDEEGDADNEFGAANDAAGDIAVVVAEVPEPTTGMILLGAGAIGLLRRTRRTRIVI